MWVEEVEWMEDTQRLEKHVYWGESKSGTRMQSSKETAINVPADRQDSNSRRQHSQATKPRHSIANLSKDTLYPHATCNSHLSKESA